MTTKNAEKQKGKTTPQMEVMKKDASKDSKVVEKATKPQPTVEELQKQLAELKKKLEAEPKDLDSKIEYFNQKKELIRKLTRLEESRDNLQVHLDGIAEISAANEFDNDFYILTIEGGENSYNKKQVFALQNPVIIGDVITYMLGKMEAKVDVLKKEIEA